MLIVTFIQDSGIKHKSKCQKKSVLETISPFFLSKPPQTSSQHSHIKQIVNVKHFSDASVHIWDFETFVIDIELCDMSE